MYALHRIPRLTSVNDDPGGLLICATQDELLFCSLVVQEQGIVRRLLVDGIPLHLLWSEYLETFVVTYEKTHLLAHDKSPRRLGPHAQLPGTLASVDKNPPVATKMQQVGLHLVGPESFASRDHGLSMGVTQETNESVHALIHWAPTDGEHHYEWFVLALEQTSVGFPRCCGRVVCINAKTLSRGSPDRNPKIAFRSPEEPVTAICAYKMSSLLIAAGRELHLHHLDFSTRKWKTLSKHAIPSRANAISCQGSLIFIATAQHSIYVLVERDDQLFEHKSDTEARCTKDVVAFGGTSAIFSAWNAGTTDIVAFSGFNKDGKQPFPLFHATLPLLVGKLRLDPRSSSQQSARYRFHASASDGTIFHLSLLKQNEWELLHFLEKMSYMDKKSIKAVLITKKDVNDEKVIIRPPTIKLTDMHVQGDRLLMMIEPGPYNLRNVLRSPELLETFHTLAKHLLGDTEHPIEAVAIWLRRLLRYPSRG